MSSIQSNQTLSVYHGNNITLLCRADLSGTVRWHFAKSGMTPQVIFNGNSIDSKYVGRVSVDVDQNLTLHNVLINESGWYICVRDGSFHHIMLDVYG